MYLTNIPPWILSLTKTLIKPARDITNEKTKLDVFSCQGCKEINILDMLCLNLANEK